MKLARPCNLVGMKVRWTQACAGGCGTTLRVGALAHRLHGTLWCGDCFTRHARKCRVPVTARSG